MESTELGRNRDELIDSPTSPPSADDGRCSSYNPPVRGRAVSLPNSNAEFNQIINLAAIRGAYDCLMENETHDIKPWYRPLLLQVSVVKPNQAVTQDTLSSTLCSHDVLSFMTCNDDHHGCKLYFDPMTYPPQLNDPTKIDMEDKHLLKLVEYIKQSCRDCNHGSYLKKNGTCKNKRSLYITCFCDKSSSIRTSDTSSKFNYREQDLRSDRVKNTREDGKSLPRRTKSSRTEDGSNKCKFKFSIFVDHLGYHLKELGNSGKRCVQVMHTNHPWKCNTVTRYPSRILPTTIREDVTALKDSHAGDGVGRNYVYTKSGVTLTRQQIRWIHGGKRRMISKLFPNLPTALYGQDPPSTFDIMIRDMKQAGDISYSILYDSSQINGPVGDSNNSSTSIITTNLHCQKYDCTQKQETEHDICIQNNEDQDASTFATQHRNGYNLTHDQHLLIGFGWVNDRERILSSFFHHVIKIDCTGGICNEDGRLLLTMSSIDSNGDAFVFLRVIIPNERAWVFKWVFQTILTNLFPSDHFRGVKVFITDGDSQEFTQLDTAIKIFYPAALRLRCGWHLVHKGFRNYGPSFGRSRSKIVNKLIRIITQWLYSWMKASGGVESKEECCVSICLFLYFIDTNPTLRGHLTQDGRNTLNCFVREKILVHLEHCAFYLRKFVRHYDDFTNSSHEGTNNGVKNHSAYLSQSFGLEQTTSVLNFQSKIAHNEKKVKASNEVTGTKLWSASPTSKRVTTLAESIILKQRRLSKNYLVFRLTHRRWLVVVRRFETEQYNDDISNAIPRFHHVRVLDLKEDNILYCSCGMFERDGLCCRHQEAVLGSIFGDKYKGISHEDVSIIWLSRYLDCAYNPSDSNRDLAMKLKLVIGDNDTKGPLISQLPDGFDNFVPPTEIPQEFVTHHIHDSVLQSFYTKEIVQRALTKYGNLASLESLEVKNILPNIHQEVHLSNQLSQQMNVELEYQDALENIITSELNERTPTTKLSVTNESSEYYTETVPIFREAVSALQDFECTRDEVETFKNMMSTYTSELRAKKAREQRHSLFETNLNDHPPGIWVSSNVAFTKSSNKRIKRSKYC